MDDVKFDATDQRNDSTVSELVDTCSQSIEKDVFVIKSEKTPPTLTTSKVHRNDSACVGASESLSMELRNIDNVNHVHAGGFRGQCTQYENFDICNRQVIGHVIEIKPRVDNVQPNSGTAITSVSDTIITDVDGSQVVNPTGTSIFATDSVENEHRDNVITIKDEDDEVEFLMDSGDKILNENGEVELTENKEMEPKTREQSHLEHASSCQSTSAPTSRTEAKGFHFSITPPEEMQMRQPISGESSMHSQTTEVDAKTKAGAIESTTSKDRTTPDNPKKSKRKNRMTYTRTIKDILNDQDSRGRKTRQSSGDETNTTVNLTEPKSNDGPLNRKTDAKMAAKLKTAKIILKCPLCDEVFPSKHYLREHAVLHMSPDQWEFECEICKERFPYKDKLQSHALKHSSAVKPKFKCENCNAKFMCKEKLEAHSVFHLPPAQWLFECESCNERFPTRQRLTRHKVKHLPVAEWKYECKTCNERFPFGQYLKRHAARHLPQEEWKHECDTCKKRFPYLQQLRSHSIQHLPLADWKFQCEICNKRFPSKRRLNEHIGFKHPPEVKSACNQCQMSFSTQISLQRHVSRVHSTQKYPCNQCGKVFKNGDCLRSHKIVHLDRSEYRFVCEYCARKFAIKKRLQAHIRDVHKKLGKSNPRKEATKRKIKVPRTMERVQCELCKESFASKFILQRHKSRIHNELRTKVRNVSKPNTIDGLFVCELCKKTFTNKVSFQRHTNRTHSTQKYFCEECGKEFKNSDILRCHKVSHLDPSEYKFTCEFCSKTFPTKKQLDSHVNNRHTKINTHFCKICGVGFTGPTYLVNHMKTHSKKPGNDS